MTGVVAQLRRLFTGLLTRSTFQDPPKAPLVIVEHVNPEFIKVLDLERVPHATLTTGYEKLYLGTGVILQCLLNIWRLRRLTTRDLGLVYLVACLRHIRPRLVVTFVHNSPLFYRMAREFSEATFVVVQNGMDSAVDRSFEMDSLIAPVTYYCFGEGDLLLHAARSLKPATIIPVGSVLSSRYKASNYFSQPAIQYDLCLVSQFRPSQMPGDTEREDPYQAPQSETLRVLAGYIKRLRLKHALRICVAGTTLDDRREQSFFEDTCGPDVDFSFRKFSSTYQRMDQSRVVVGVCSSSLYEAFSWGKKTLFCDLTEPAGAPYAPLDGVWALRGQHVDFELFEERVLTLLAMDDGEYAERSRTVARHFVAYDHARPACEVVKTHLHSILRLTQAMTRTPVFQGSVTAE